MELHLQKLQYPEFRYMDFLQEKSVSVDDHPLKQSFRENLNLCQVFLKSFFMKFQKLSWDEVTYIFGIHLGLGTKYADFQEKISAEISGKKLQTLCIT